MRTALITFLLLPATALGQMPSDYQVEDIVDNVQGWLPADYDWTSESGKLLKTGIEQFQANYIATAGGLFSQAKAADPRLPRFDVWLGLLVALMGHFDTSYGYLDHAAKSDPDDPRVWTIYAMIEFHNNRVASSRALLDRAEKAMAKGTLDAGFARQCRYQWLIAKGRTSDAFELWQEGLACFEELIKTAPEPRFFVSAAKMQHKLGRNDEAVKLLSTTAVKDEFGTNAQAMLADWSSQAGNHEEAFKFLAIAMKADPENALLVLKNGTCLRALGRHDEAYAELERSAKLGYTDLAEIEGHKGLAAFAKGDYATAEQHFAIIHSAAPDNSSIATYYALALIESEDSAKQALAHTLAQRLRHGPNASVNDAATSAWVDFRRGQADSASADMAIAMTNPEDNTLYFNAVMLEKEGKTDEALVFLEVICKRDGLFSYRDQARALRDKILAAQGGERKKDAPTAAQEGASQ